MKAGIVSLVLIASLLLVAFGATPVQAGAKTTEFTGTIVWVSWDDPVPPIYTGGAMHEWPTVGFDISTNDTRINGLFLVHSKYLLPPGKPFPFGSVTGTWSIYSGYTLDERGQPVPVGQPLWEGVVATTANPEENDQWNVTGSGLGPYVGQHISFKVYNLSTIVGQVIGN